MQISLLGPVYTVGVGLDIIKGVNLALSYNLYSLETTVDETKKETLEKSIGFGVTLTSDLWYALMKQ